MPISDRKFESTVLPVYFLNRFPAGTSDDQMHTHFDDGVDTPDITSGGTQTGEDGIFRQGVDQSNVPVYVDTVTAVKVAFYHNGSIIFTEPTVQLYLFNGRTKTQLATALVEMNTGGAAVAEEYTFTGLSLTRDDMANLEVSFDWTAGGGGSPPDPWERDIE